MNNSGEAISEPDSQIRLIPALGLATVMMYTKPMLTGLSKTVRFWIAMSFIALYAVCILAPTAALAFNGASCLTEHELVQAHSHADDGAHQHGDDHNHAGATDTPADDDSASSKCCGMVFCSALAPELASSLAPAVLSGRTASAVMQDFTGLPPHKLIRPPRSQS